MLFGQLAELTGSNTIAVDNAGTTEELRSALCKQYPVLKETKFVIAVNKKMIFENTPVNADSAIALLPPFSGG